MKKTNKTLIIGAVELSWKHIGSIEMMFGINPCLVINTTEQANLIIACRNTNTVGCAICSIGTFLNSTHYTHLEIKSILNFDKDHVIEFKMETWHE